MLDSDFKKLIDAIKSGPLGNTFTMCNPYLYGKPKFETNDLHAELDDKQAVELAEILKENYKISYLRLTNVRMSQYGFHAFAEMLKVNTTLKMLELNVNKWFHLYSDKTSRNPGDILPIIKALETNKSLKSIDLSGCNLGNEDAQAFKTVFETNNKLERVRLQNNNIESSGGFAIAAGLMKNTQLFELNLLGNKLGDDYTHFIELARQNTNLSNLCFDAPLVIRNQMHDARNDGKSKQLLEKAQPKPLVFNPPALPERKLVTEEATVFLAPKNSERRLVAEKSAIRLAPERDPDIMPADKFKKLAEDVRARLCGKTLHLNDLIDDGQTITLTEILKKDTTIRSLQLPTNRIGRKGFLAIASMLQVNTTLETMDLYHNRNYSKMVGSGNILPIIHTFKYSKSCLQHIYLRDCNLNDDDAMAFEEVLETNDSLLAISLSNNPIGLMGLNALVTGLGKNNSLTGLYLEGNEFQVDSRKTSLVTLNSVIWPYGQNREEILEQIRKFTHINYQRRMHKISLQQGQQRQEQQQEAQEKSLKEDAEPKQADDHVPEIDIQWHLDEAPDLPERKLVTEESMIGLPPAAEEIKLLAEKPSVCLTPEEIKLKAEETFPLKQEEDPILFQRHPDIMHDLKFNELLNEIQNRPSLKPNEILDEIQKSPYYRTLIFDTELIDDKQAIELAEILKQDRTIDTLKLPTNKIGKQGFLAIAEMLTINTKLETISLHFNPSYPTMLDSGNILPIIKALESNQSLQCIYLENCKLNDDDAEALKKVFEVNTKLRSIHLSNNHIGSSGGIAIAKSLESNRSLTFLSLEGNELQGAYSAFAALVEKNTTLEWLKLDSSTAGRKEILELINKRIDRNVSKRLRLENAQREQLRLENVRREYLKTVELVSLMQTKMHSSQFLEFNGGENCEGMVFQPLYPGMPQPSSFDNRSATSQAVASPASSSEASSLPAFAGDSKSASEARSARIETFPVYDAPRYIDNDEETQLALALSFEHASCRSSRPL